MIHLREGARTVVLTFASWTQLLEGDKNELGKMALGALVSEPETDIFTFKSASPVRMKQVRRILLRLTVFLMLVDKHRGQPMQDINAHVDSIQYC